MNSPFAHLVDHEHAHAKRIKEATLRAATAAIHESNQRYMDATKALKEGKITSEEFMVVFKAHEAAGPVFAAAYAAFKNK